ncbi:DUF647-domain-containing protein [Punctularia strigosozonata HHB-11173 SS5]|uniref:DUF647-domain-containing protein n=1 Tax=Punctularia strigosozonata (strain HHB-11173) TaxID=741275 RepID=UPI000441801B|nr:DUF647-domain-containing protein [Punctularia strigosozonata HHB-11173 SS5]EIN09022.1 DUF647-domain-containing protein [Punctularia strigosozonata HHB-11173 SS5]
MEYEGPLILQIKHVHPPSSVVQGGTSRGLKHLLTDVFLPAGYPSSVSPDYLRYQTYNAFQAFCSSLANLIASRAVLEGFGVGNASASATHAMLLTVLQDVFGRLTTVAGGYYLGTALSPEAKTYRLLADVFNDASIVLDVFQPFYASVPVAGARVLALCSSGCLRALCGVCAGGSKAALAVHFASAGDLGDLNAKDGSRETVIGLVGLLSGTILLSYIGTPGATYAALCALLGAHLALNYLAVRAVAMRTLTRQRASIAWRVWMERGAGAAPTPEEVAEREGLLADPTLIADGTGRRLGRCSFGGARSQGFIATTGKDSAMVSTSRLIEAARYWLLIDSKPGSIPTATILLKRVYGPEDLLKAWVHALRAVQDRRAESSLQSGARGPQTFNHGHGPDSAGHTDHDEGNDSERLFERFAARMRDAGWRVDDGLLLPGTPDAVDLEVVSEVLGANAAEAKKTT